MRNIRKSCKSKFSKEMKLQIVLEYIEGDKTMGDLCEKYGINNRSTISNWISRYIKKKKSVTLHPRLVIGDTVMETISAKDKSKDDLLSLLEQKDEELRRKTMEVLALNKLIEIAERNGVSVRKNSGAKQ